MQSLIFNVIKKGPYNTYRIYMGQWNDKGESQSATTVPLVDLAG